MSNFKNKIGRNDPCPCGSEKKHKKCCLDDTPITTGRIGRSPSRHGNTRENFMMDELMSDPFTKTFLKIINKDPSNFDLNYSPNDIPEIMSEYCQPFLDDAFAIVYDLLPFGETIIRMAWNFSTLETMGLVDSGDFHYYVLSFKYFLLHKFLQDVESIKDEDKLDLSDFSEIFVTIQMFLAAFRSRKLEKYTPIKELITDIEILKSKKGINKVHVKTTLDHGDILESIRDLINIGKDKLSGLEDNLQNWLNNEDIDGDWDEDEDSKITAA